MPAVGPFAGVCLMTAAVGRVAKAGTAGHAAAAPTLPPLLRVLPQATLAATTTVAVFGPVYL